MKAKSTQMWKALDFKMIFLAVLPQFISPGTSISDPSLNFAIYHGDSAVSAFISNPAAAHGIPSALHRPPILCTQDLGMRSLREEYCYVL